MPSGEIDITQNIKLIESYQCELLNLLAQLYSSMQNNKIGTKERAEILSDMVIMIYLLSERLGVSFTALDTKILNHLRIGILEEEANTQWKTALLSLRKHIDKTRDFQE